MKNYSHETACGRCVFFAVDHNGGAWGWAKALTLFAWHRVNGACRRTIARVQAATSVASATSERATTDQPPAPEPGGPR